MQSSLNMLCYLLNINDLFMDVVEDPDSVQQVADPYHPEGQETFGMFFTKKDIVHHNGR